MGKNILKYVFVIFIFLSLARLCTCLRFLGLEYSLLEYNDTPYDKDLAVLFIVSALNAFPGLTFIF